MATILLCALYSRGVFKCNTPCIICPRFSLEEQLPLFTFLPFRLFEKVNIIGNFDATFVNLPGRVIFLNVKYSRYSEVSGKLSPIYNG